MNGPNDTSDAFDSDSAPYEEELDPAIAQAVKSDPENADELDIAGTTPDPAVIESQSTIDEAHKSGLYTKATDEKPMVPLNVAEEVEKAEKNRQE